MNSFLSEVIDAICLERDDESYSKAFNAMDTLLNEYGENNLADRLFNEIPRTVPYEIVVDLFNILAWSTSDNGAKISRTIESWLKEGKDNRKLHIALNLEFYPFLTRKEMELVLSKLAESNGTVSHRCLELIESRKLLNENI